MTDPMDLESLHEVNVINNRVSGGEAEVYHIYIYSVLTKLIEIN